MFWNYLVSIRSEACLNLFWEYLNGKLFTVLLYTEKTISALTHTQQLSNIFPLPQLPSDETLTILDTVMIGVLSRARIFKLLRSPRTDSKEPIPPDCVACCGPVRQPYSYSVPSTHRFFKNSSIVRLDFAWISSFSIRRCFLFARKLHSSRQQWRVSL
jgi:hypothetical protein